MPIIILNKKFNHISALKSKQNIKKNITIPDNKKDIMSVVY